MTQNSPDHAAAKNSDPQTLSLSAGREDLIEALVQAPDLLEKFKDAVKSAEGRLWRQEQDRRNEREEAERVTNIKGWLATVAADLGVGNMTVGHYQGARAMNQFSYGIYQDGNWVGNAVSRPGQEITKADIQLCVLELKGENKLHGLTMDYLRPEE